MIVLLPLSQAAEATGEETDTEIMKMRLRPQPLLSRVSRQKQNNRKRFVNAAPCTGSDRFRSKIVKGNAPVSRLNSTTIAKKQRVLFQSEKGDIRMAKILVVDDNEQLNSMLKDVLESWDYTALMVTEGFIRLDVARREMPDIILLDIMLPACPATKYAAL